MARRAWLGPVSEARVDAVAARHAGHGCEASAHRDPHGNGGGGGGAHEPRAGRWGRISLLHRRRRRSSRQRGRLERPVLGGGPRRCQSSVDIQRLPLRQARLPHQAAFVPRGGAGHGVGGLERVGRGARGVHARVVRRGTPARPRGRRGPGHASPG